MREGLQKNIQVNSDKTVLEQPQDQKLEIDQNCNEQIDIFDEQFMENFNKLMRLPNDFDQTDIERIRIFGERLRYVRETAKDRNAQILYDDNGHPYLGPKFCNVHTAKDLAFKLGVTPAAITDYEKGKYKSVPVRFLLDLYDIYGATPHYLLGYSSDLDRIVQLDVNGNIVYKDGKPKELVEPMVYPFSCQKRTYNSIGRLMWESPEHFMILSKLFSADKETQDAAYKILDIFLYHSTPKR